MRSRPDPDGRVGSLVRDRIAGELGATFVPARWISIGLRLPVVDGSRDLVRDRAPAVVGTGSASGGSSETSGSAWYALALTISSWWTPTCSLLPQPVALASASRPKVVLKRNDDS